MVRWRLVSCLSFRYENAVRIQALSLTSISLLLVPSLAQAHDDFEVSGAFGYRLGGKVPVESTTGEEDTGKLTFEGAPAFTAILGYRSQPDGFAFLSYTRQQTRVGYDAPNDGNDSPDQYERVSIENFQIGGNLETTRGIFVPYLGASVGIARIASLDGGSSNYFFSPVLDGGLKLDVHDHVHLRILGRLPVIFAKKSVVCGASGTCFTPDTLRPFAQFELMAGAGVSF